MVRSSVSPDAAASLAGRYAELPVGGFLDALASPGPAPAGGSAAALALAQAAALCAKAARLSASQLAAGQAARLASEADTIRAAATALIDQDALGYLAAIKRRRQAAGPDRPAAAAQALASAASVPMRIVELAGPLAELAAELAAAGNRALRGDAITAALLAHAAASAATLLVRIDLAGRPDDARPARAAELVSQIGQALSRAMS